MRMGILYVQLVVPTGIKPSHHNIVPFDSGGDRVEGMEPDLFHAIWKQSISKDLSVMVRAIALNSVLQLGQTLTHNAVFMGKPLSAVVSFY